MNSQHPVKEIVKVEECTSSAFVFTYSVIMLGNGGSKMDLNHLNGCIERHRFLSPRFSSCFSSYSQRTDCKLCAEPHVYTAPNINDISSTKHSSPFLRLFSSWRASCESDSPAPKATDRMERARESLKQLEGARAQVVSEVEIQNYLAKETGKDRLQKMFTREWVTFEGRVRVDREEGGEWWGEGGGVVETVGGHDQNKIERLHYSSSGLPLQ